MKTAAHIIRLKTQFMDFAVRQNESVNREPMKTIGEELERVTHLKCLGTSIQKRNVVHGGNRDHSANGTKLEKKLKKCRVVLCA